MAVVNFIELPNKISADEVTVLITKKEDGHTKEITKWEKDCEVSLELFSITLNGFEGFTWLQELFKSQDDVDKIVNTFVDNYNKKFTQTSYYTLLTNMQKMLNDVVEEFVYLCSKANIKTESDYVKFRMCMSRNAVVKDRNIGNRLVILEKLYNQQKNILGEYLWVECGMPTKVEKKVSKLNKE